MSSQMPRLEPVNLTVKVDENGDPYLTDEKGRFKVDNVQAIEALWDGEAAVRFAKVKLDLWSADPRVQPARDEGPRPKGA